MLGGCGRAVLRRAAPPRKAGGMTSPISTTTRQPPDVSHPAKGSDAPSLRQRPSYGLAIFPQHAALLAASAISPEVSRERGYVSVDTKKRLESAGFAQSQRTEPGLLIPIHATDGEIRLHQYRPDAPRIAADGREIKYETPWRHPICLDVPPPARADLGDPDVPLWVTEGARKADAAVTAGLCCIGLLGVDGWQRKGAALP